MTDTVKVLKEIRALLNGRVLYGELETARRMLTELIAEISNLELGEEERRDRQE